MEKPTIPQNDNQLIPQEGNDKVGLTVFELLAKVIKDKEDIGIHQRIKRNHEMRAGHHWKKPHGEVPFVAANLIFNHMQKNCNLLTDNNPIFNVAKMGEVSDENQESFEMIQRTAEHWWTDQEQQDIFEDTVLNGEQYGVTIEKVLFNRELEWGGGEVETLSVDPLYFGFWPTKLKSPRDLQKCEALFYFYPMSVREVKRKWPKTAEKVKTDQEMIKELNDDRREINQKTDSESGFFGTLITIASEIKQMLSFKFDSEEDEQDTLVCECWCKDYTYQTAERKNVGKVKRPKYPGFIRRITACNGGRVVLSDDPNPSINPELDIDSARKTYLWDKYPFNARNSVRDTSNAWGSSDVQQLEKLNMEFNKSLSQLVLTKDRKARAKIINPRTSGVEDNEFTNVPGIIHPTNTIEAAGIRYLTFDGDVNDYLQAINLFKDIFYAVAGTFELEQAQQDGRSVIAYKAIAALIEQASTMRKGKIRAYSAMIRERGRCFISLAQNWYTDERWITYSKDGEQQTSKVDNSMLMIPARLTVVTGSTMPVSKVQKREEAIALYQQGAIDQEALLEELDWGNRRDVLRRMKEGPFGMFAERLQMLETPPELVEFLMQVGMMEDKDFQKALEKGELPTVPMLLQQMMEQMQGQEQEPDPMQMLEMEEKQADVQEKSARAQKVFAEIAKIEADRALTAEQITTERVEQQVKIAGISFDDEKLKLERQRVVNELAAKLQAEKGKHSESQPGFTERGLKTNNEE